VVVPFVMVLPVVYLNTAKGIRAADPLLLEMAQLFRVPRWKRVCALYAPAAAPFLIAAASIGIGFAWKSGISAELIGVAHGTIGGQLHRAQIAIQTVDMYAWTVTIVVLSYTLSKVFDALTKQGGKP